MFSFVLQDWTSINVGGGLLDFTQGESDWLSLQPFQDVSFWCEVKAITAGGGAISVEYHTSPTKDEGLFATMATAGPVVVGQLIVTPVLLAALPAVPLARWVRWRLVNPGAGAVWGMTFRIHCAANAVGLL